MCSSKSKHKGKTGCRTLVPFKGAVFDVAVSTGLPLPFLKHRSGSSRSLSFRNATNCSKAGGEEIRCVPHCRKSKRKGKAAKEQRKNRRQVAALMDETDCSR